LLEQRVLYTHTFLAETTFDSFTINDRHVYPNEPNEHFRPCGTIQLLSNRWCKST
jgi:hypothetical protein